MDLFTCGNNPLIPVVKTIEKLFGPPRAGDKVQTQWSHELRGFRRTPPSEEGAAANENYALLDHNSDLSQIVWSPFDCTVKEQVVSTLTQHQRVDIWDIVGLEDTPTHEDVLRENLQPGDPRWLTSEIVKPDRYLFLDGIMQSDSDSTREYHEAMVHPGMFTHPQPKNIGIVGGAEGATLREVLKHKTVESVTMIEIDEELVGMMREHMPASSDCTDLLGRADSCFDDKLASIEFEDAVAWIGDRFGPSPSKEAKEKFDVVIVDAIEPEANSRVSRNLYSDVGALKSIVNSLSDDGVLVMQVGRAPSILDPKPDIGFAKNREALFQNLESIPEVEAMFVYEDAHCGFIEPRAFLIACRSEGCRSRFYATSDVIDYEIYDRIIRTKSKQRALVYYDGVTHFGYQYAPKAWETVYCRREPTPFECAYRHMDMRKPIFEYDITNEEDGDFTITGDWNEDETEVIKTHVFAAVDIPKGSYIMPDHLASSLVLSERSIKGLEKNIEYGGVSVIEDFVSFIQDHGHDSKNVGSERVLVEVGASYLIDTADDEKKANVARWIPPHPAGKRPVYSPVYERHRHSFDVFIVASKDIKKGEEILKPAGLWDKE